VDPKYGPLTDIFRAAGFLVSASTAITFLWKKRANWEPAEEDLPHGARRISSLVTSVALGIMWLNTGNDGGRRFQEFALVLGATVLVSFLVYGALAGFLRYRKRGPDKNGHLVDQFVVGGFQLRNAARAKVQQKKNPPTVQQLFEQAGFDADQIWTRSSLVAARLLLSVGYLGMVVSGTLALSSTAILLALRSTSAISAPSVPTNKRVINIAVVRNGGAHYAQDIATGFREKLERLLEPTAYAAHFEEADGFAEVSRAKENAPIFEALLGRFSSKPDYLVTIGTGVSRFAREHYLNSIPIVFVGVSDPVLSGLVPSLRGESSRGNIAGTAYGMSPEATLRFLIRVFARKKYAFIYSDDFPQDAALLTDYNGLAARFSPPPAVVPLHVDKPPLTAEQASVGDVFFGRYLLSTNMEAFTRATPKPFVGQSLNTLYNGGVVSYGVDDINIGELAAESIIVKNLVDNVSLSEMDVLTEFRNVIGVNLSAARRAGITIPADVIAAAVVRVP